MRTRWIVILLLVALTLPLSLTTIPAFAQQPARSQTTLPELTEFTTRTDPVSLIGAYYNAISRRNYAAAYAMWEQPPLGQTEAEFANGFADTTRAYAFVRLPVVVDAGAGNLHAQLPTMVIGENADGTQQVFTGCLTAHKVNVPVGDAPEPDPNWYLRDFTLTAQTTPDFAQLETACGSTFTLTSNPFPVDTFDPLGLIESYFTALARNDTALAGRYWGEGITDDFQQRFTGVINLNLIVNPEVFAEGAAGSIYSAVPTLAIVETADQGTHFITACIVTRKSNVPVGNASEPDPNWWIEEVRGAEEVADASASVAALKTVCA